MTPLQKDMIVSNELSYYEDHVTGPILGIIETLGGSCLMENLHRNF